MTPLERVVELEARVGALERRLCVLEPTNIVPAILKTPSVLHNPRGWGDHPEGTTAADAYDGPDDGPDVLPVDRSARILTNGLPESEMPDYREHEASGMQKSYVVLSPDERAKGFVRPVRQSYRHKTCRQVTTMGLALAETYARDPGFYGGTFCATCRAHFPLVQFVWEGTNEQVGL